MAIKNVQNLELATKKQVENQSQVTNTTRFSDEKFPGGIHPY